MKDGEIAEVLARLRGGAALRVPFSTTLYPDTLADRNVLRAKGDGFELTTSYREFWAGHGYSVEMTEVEIWSEAQLRSTLTYAERDQIVEA